MDSNPHLQRAQLLIQQGRHEMAEKELRQHLASLPQDALAQAMLAMSLLEQERRDEAEHAAREAIGFAPDMAFAHYALARVLTDRMRLDDAAGAIREALRLEPEDADYHAMRAAIEFARENWNEALEAADTGLQYDPEHVACNNFRAMALVKLGRKAAAGATIQAALARNPDNALSHANQGWTYLEQGRRKDAMNHFRESLRLDPGQEWARAGLVEAIKAGNPLYAVMLKYFLWMQKLSNGARWGILIGGYIGIRFLATLSQTNPEWSPWITPIRILYVAFALMTWLAYPIFNLMLFVHPFGRHALSPEQRRQASWVGGCMLLALVSLGFLLVPNLREASLRAALAFGLLAMPVAGIFMCPEGWPRWVMVAITAGLALLGLLPVFMLAVLHPEKGSAAHAFSTGALGFFLLGFFVSQWVAIWLSNQQPTR